MHSARPVSGCIARRPAPLTRRRAVRVGAAALAMPFLPRLAGAAAFTWRIGHAAPVTFPLHIRLVEAAAAIAVASEGKLDIQILPNGELGSPIGLLAQARQGSIDGAALSHQVLAGDLAGAALPMTGFAFTGYDRLWEAMDGDMGAMLRQQMRDRLGLIAPRRCWDFGFRQVTTSARRIETAADVIGLRIRTPPEAGLISLFQALKALPVGIPLSALERALRSHAAEAQEGMVPLVEVAKLYQVQSTCALTNHVWDGQWICVSGRSWSKLPPKLQDVVSAALDESGLRQRQDIARDEAKTRSDLEAQGVKFNAVEIASFRAVLRSADYYSKARSKMGDTAWAVLEKYSGKLA
jgi:TRAP-type C4-dicarboxylate transport system substrate-binding protein